MKYSYSLRIFLSKISFCPSGLDFELHARLKVINSFSTVLVDNFENIFLLLLPEATTPHFSETLSKHSWVVISDFCASAI